MLCMTKNTGLSSSRLPYISPLLCVRLERQYSRLVIEPVWAALEADDYDTSEDGIRLA